MMTGPNVTPLLLAEEAFPAMERAVLSSERTVKMAFRIFDPDLRLRDPNVSAKIDPQTGNAPTWADLLKYKANQGVQTLILLTDFPPVMAFDLHQMATRSVQNLDEITREEIKAKAQFHGGKFGIVARWLFWPLVFSKLKERIDRLNGLPESRRDTELAEAPGIGPLIKIKDGLIKARLKLPVMRAGTHHQKLLLCDDNVAFLGGLDLNERRYDTAEHQQPAGDSWYDVSFRIDGACTPLHEHFDQLVAKKEMSPWGPLQGAETKQKGVTFVRTVTTDANHPLATVPKSVDQSLKSANLLAINAATKLLYIETQFLRSADIADAIVSRAHEALDLQVVCLIAAAPDEVAFEGQDNIGMRHGEYLQNRAIEKLKLALGARLKLLTLARQTDAQDDDSVENERAQAHGAGLIHIHAKILIADDTYCVFGSANLNDRSFACDTEIGALWHDPSGIRAFRNRLACHHLGLENEEDFSLTDLPTALEQQAFVNASEEPAQRRGFIVPFERYKTASYARRVWYLPDQLV